jgi:hypothetical protein
MPDRPEGAPESGEEQKALPPTDYRRIRRKTDRQMLLLVLGGLLLFGGGLIFLIYGKWALATGLLCLIPGAGLILFLWGLLTLIERWVGD